MREIKFRAKRKDNGKWVEGNILKLKCCDSDDGYDYYIIPEITNGSWCKSNFALKFISPCFNVLSETVCQYTDFRDRNMAEIWEYDIVNCPESERCGYISWNESKGGFYFNTFSKDRGFEEEPMCDYIDEFEVIGNVFDNKELLEVVEK